jgi:hypothetical protein
MKKLILLAILLMVNYSFSSTVIDTATTTPFNSNQRNICRDGAGNLHIVWKQSTNTIAYANSTDGINWRLSYTIVNSTGTKLVGAFPSISCNGNNITIAYSNYTYVPYNNYYTLVVWNSTDNGATFSPLIAYTLDADEQAYNVQVERRGQNIYLVFEYYNNRYDTCVQGGWMDIVFINSTTAGSTWGSAKFLTAGTCGGSGQGYSKDSSNPSMVVNGTGNANDNIFVAFAYTDTSPTTDIHNVSFKNSSTSGANWSSLVTIFQRNSNIEGQYYPSITYKNETQLYATWTNSSDTVIPTANVMFSNSTNGGVSWSAYQTIDNGTGAGAPSITTDSVGDPVVFWFMNNSGGSDVFYRRFNEIAGTWDNWVNFTSNEPTRNHKMPNVKFNWNNNIMDVLWYNGTSPYTITYMNATFPDLESPKYSLNSTNSTLLGTPVKHSLYWQDNRQLSFAILSFDNCTGTLRNVTNMSLSGAAAWSNFTVDINSTIGCTIRWCVWANDTSNNWNETSCGTPFNYTTTPPSTLIDTTTTIPFVPSRRAICRDGTNHIHIVWVYNSSVVNYANSSDNGVTFTTKNLTLSTDGYKWYPSIACNPGSSTILVSYLNSTQYDDNAMFLKSSNGGTDWTTILTKTADSYVEANVEVKGNRVYAFWGGSSDINLTVSTDGGNTWNTPVKIFESSSWYDDDGCSHHISYASLSISVSGTGTSSDKIFTTAEKYISDEEWITHRCSEAVFTYGLFFKNSTDGGSTFGPEQTILAPQTYEIAYMSMTHNTSNSSNIFVVYDVTPDYINIHRTYFSNTTNGGASWTTPYQISIGTNDSYYPTVTLNDTRPFVLWRNGTTISTHDIFYRNYNGTSWDNVAYFTTDHNGNDYPNAKWDYSGNCIEFVYVNGTISPYNVTYSHIGTCLSPLLNVSPTTSSSCGALLYKVRLFNSTGSLLNSTVTTRILNPSGTIKSQVTSATNNGTGIYLGSYQLEFNASLGTWTIKVTELSGITGAVSVTVSNG